MREFTMPCSCCGTLLTFDEQNVLECPACGTPNARSLSTGPSLEMLQRAVTQRLACDFQEAESSYQQVLLHFPEEHEALWGRLLCRYGVEYVEDPASRRLLPTVHSVQRKPLQEQSDFVSACQFAPEPVAAQYQRDAVYIDAAQAEIRRLAETCPPYDVFICHKTTKPRSREKTEDFHRAYQLYHFLKEQKVRAFFAPESLATVVGANYEAGIYNALSTARFMLIICSQPEYITSPWVRSEWTRFLDMIDDGQAKRLVPLIYDGFDPASIPQFRYRSLQGIDMSQITAPQTLLELVRPAEQATGMMDKLRGLVGMIPMDQIKDTAAKLGVSASNQLDALKEQAAERKAQAEIRAQAEREARAERDARAREEAQARREAQAARDAQFRQEAQARREAQAARDAQLRQEAQAKRDAAAAEAAERRKVQAERDAQLRQEAQIKKEAAAAAIAASRPVNAAIVLESAAPCPEDAVQLLYSGPEKNPFRNSVSLSLPGQNALTLKSGDTTQVALQSETEAKFLWKNIWIMIILLGGMTVFTISLFVDFIRFVFAVSEDYMFASFTALGAVALDLVLLLALGFFLLYEFGLPEKKQTLQPGRKYLLYCHKKGLFYRLICDEITD